jgi:RimJ/RimL family protein N-acetyltransferase
MMYYPVNGKNMILKPLGSEDSLTHLDELSRQKDFRENSRVCPWELNISDSPARLTGAISMPGYWFYNRLYIIASKTDNKPLGITGFTHIDWIERRADLILIMDTGAVKTKMSYEPLKLLLKTGIHEWHLRRIRTHVLQTHTATITVLKGFGFSKEGTLREEIYYNGEYIDIDMYGLLTGEFHYVDEGTGK